MTRRERLEAKLEKRLDWAESRDKKSEQAFESARRIADNIPLGQPILIGHHSERHHRRDIARIDSGMSRGVESMKMAAHHRSAAAGIEHALERSIFSDDPDAPEALAARIAELEAKRERMKAENAAFKKGPAAYAAHLGITAEQEAARRVEIMARYSWMRKPHAAYELSNLGGNISRLRERVTSIERRASRAEAAEAAPSGVLIEGDTYVRVTFAEKPARAILDSLKAAGFRWGSGSWVGERAKLPEGIQP